MIIEECWQKPLEEMRKDSSIRTVYIVGGIDTGKTTLSCYLFSSLIKQFSLGYIDCDPGQTIIGPPCTIGLGIYKKNYEKPDLHKQDALYFRFIGATSPTHHLLQTLVGIKRCVEKAQSLPVEKIIIDSSGFIKGKIAREFQFQVIDCIRPDCIIEITCDYSLKQLLLNFEKNTRIINLEASLATRSRSPEERKQYREKRFRHYFMNSKLSVLDLSHIGFHGMIPNAEQKDQWQNLLIALCNKNQFVITLGIIQMFDMKKKELHLLSPPFSKEKVVSVHFGSIQLDPSGVQKV
jgi:polynucleotide 5'-hydroxyl-kinase GRC3/NOL9